MNIHHFVQQPWGAEHRPGNAMGQWGIHLGRYQTWWEPGKAWFAYLWRCQTLLQAGDFVPASPATSAQHATQSGTLDLQSIHRVQGKAHLYFIANIGESAGSARCSFPVKGLQPERWDPVSKVRENLYGSEAEDGFITVDLDFAPAQSFFVIFRKPLPYAGIAPRARSVTLLTELAGPWTVHFDPVWGGPRYAVEFASLHDWSKHAEKGIRYYSGTARYKKTFHLPPLDHSKKLWLELGEVKYLAAVMVNGAKLGVLWTPPWRIDITSAAREGENSLELAVTNVWANRLIGDEQEPLDINWQAGDPILKGGYFLKELPDWFLKNEARPSKGRFTFTTWNYFHDRNAPLLPSGLLGPVRIDREG